MQMHIGTKIILATAMTRQQYNDYRGWILPENEAHLASEDGFLVEYVDGGESNHPNHKGYISWSPKTVFDNSYKKSGELSFGMAVEAAKRGSKIARTGWNGAGMFAYVVPAASCEMYGIEKEIFGVDHELALRQHWRLKAAQGDIATWAPSGSDSLADDWCIVS